VRYPELVNLSPSQARAAALGVRPTPRALTLASILSGPPPATLGGRRMSRADVLATSRYFFNQLKDGASWCHPVVVSGSALPPPPLC
jgi:hypothetical protein